MIADQFLDSEEETHEEKKPRRKKAKKKPESPSSCRLGFPLDYDDECRIRRACKRAEKFMRSYGKAPQQPQIDLRHYYQKK